MSGAVFTQWTAKLETFLDTESPKGLPSLLFNEMLPLSHLHVSYANHPEIHTSSTPDENNAKFDSWLENQHIFIF